MVHDDRSDEIHVSENRRKLMSSAFLLSASTFGLVCAPNVASAKDEIFRPNPLTNPVLEQVRIWEQAEADELKYGGALERGDAGNKGKVDAYPKLLVPILQISEELKIVDQMVHQQDQWGKVKEILTQSKYQKVGFKKIFNAFGDNIYYSDPDRANVYLGGGATPSNEQSIAYLLRNDILTNVESLQAEVDYLLQHPEESAEDLYAYANGATTAMEKYLDIVPPDQVRRAREMLATTS